MRFVAIECENNSRRLNIAKSIDGRCGCRIIVACCVAEKCRLRGDDCLVFDGKGTLSGGVGRLISVSIVSGWLVGWSMSDVAFSFCFRVCCCKCSIDKSSPNQHKMETV